MADVTISGSGAHASAAATDRIPASKAGVKGYLTPDQIADFVEGRTSLAELIRDTVGVALTAGAGVTVTVNDGADTITLATTITQYTDEMARDSVGTALTDGTGIDIVVNDGADTITISVNQSELNAFTGDSGSGGVKGVVPAPAAGDAAAGKYLDADGTWSVPAGGGGSGISIGLQVGLSTSTYF